MPVSLIITTAGAAALSQAALSGTSVAVQYIAFGTSPDAHDETSTALHQNLRNFAVEDVVVSGNTVTFKATLPASWGGYHLYEMGLVTGDGVLLAVGSLDLYKPAGASGFALAVEAALTVADVSTINTDTAGLVAGANEALTQVEAKRLDVEAMHVDVLEAHTDISQWQASTLAARDEVVARKLGAFADEAAVTAYVATNAIALVSGCEYFDQSIAKTRIYSGGAWRDGVDGITEARAAELAAKHFRSALRFDGVSSSILLPAALNNVLRTGCFVFAIEVGVENGRPAANGYWIGNYAGGGRVALQLQTDGSVLATLNDGVSWVDITSDNHFTDGPCPPTWVVFAVDAASGTAQLYINGAASGVAGDISALDLSVASFGSPYLGCRGSDFYGRATFWFVRGAIFDHLLSPAEIAARFGHRPTEPIASATDLRGWLDLLDAASAWQDTTHPYSTFVGDGVDGFSATVASSSDRRAYLLTNTKLSAGDRVRVEFDVACDIPGSVQGSLYNPTSTGGSGSGLALDDEVWGGIAAQTGDEVPGFLAFTGNGRATYEGTLAADVSNMVGFRFSTTSSAVTTLTVSNFRIRRIGATVYSASQEGRLGPELRDLGANGYHGLLSPTGVSWTEPGDRGRLSLAGLVADAWLGGSQRVLIPAGCRVVDVIATETAGNAATNLALGTTANGTDLVGSFSLAAGETKRLTVTGEFVAKDAAKPIHINDAPGGVWGGASIDLTFILEPF